MQRLHRFAKALSVVTLVGVLAGCESMGDKELTWQALHAIDVAQTYNARSDGCYREIDPITRRVIGSQPSKGEVLAWGVGAAFLHARVSRALEEREAPRWVQFTWDAITFGGTTNAVVSNHREGVRPFGSNNTPVGC